MVIKIFCTKFYPKILYQLVKNEISKVAKTIKLQIKAAPVKSKRQKEVIKSEMKNGRT